MELDDCFGAGSQQRSSHQHFLHGAGELVGGYDSVVVGFATDMFEVGGMCTCASRHHPISVLRLRLSGNRRTNEYREGRLKSLI